MTPDPPGGFGPKVVDDGCIKRPSPASLRIEAPGKKTQELSRKKTCIAVWLVKRFRDPEVWRALNRNGPCEITRALERSHKRDRLPLTIDHIVGRAPGNQEVNVVVPYRCPTYWRGLVESVADPLGFRPSKFV